jgi:hypothetical protein
VRRLCTTCAPLGHNPWAQHIGVPVPIPSTALDTAEQGQRGVKRRNYMYLKDKIGITESIDEGRKRH